MKPKLFHTLVVMGAALTGGMVSAGCGGGTTPDDCDPRTQHCDGGYGNISTDAYAHIGFNPDGYPHISVDTGGPPDANEGGEAGDAGDAEASDAEAG